MTADNARTLVLQPDSTLYSRGGSQYGQMGDDTNNISNSKFTQEATIATNWTTLGVGNGDFSLARTASDQDFASTNRDTDGQLGAGSLITAVTQEVAFQQRYPTSVGSAAARRVGELHCLARGAYYGSPGVAHGH